jgi:pimeloyl-ACP methyl ester carboxylesterase
LRQGALPSARLLARLDLERHAFGLQVAFGAARAFGFNRWVLKSALEQMMPTVSLAKRELEPLVDDAMAIGAATAVGYLRALERFEVDPSRLRVPTQIIWGEKDAIVPRESLEQMAARLRRGRLLIEPGFGHAPQFEAPERLMHLLLRFVCRRSVRLRLWWWLSKLRKTKRPPRLLLSADREGRTSSLAS